MLATQGRGPDLVSQHPHSKLGRVAYVCNSSAVEAEAGGLQEHIQPR